jgi:hypothetical protein
MTNGPHVEKAGTVYSRRGDSSRAATTVGDAEGGALTHGLPTRFAHHSEAELARILDYYRIAWEYEPDVFPLAWNPDGRVIESFSPDFYLPEMDVYIELTTLKQALVRKKNRKLRWLRRLYPEIRVKLFYARDFQALMLKYGRLSFLNGADPSQVTAMLEADALEPAAPAEPILAPEPSAVAEPLAAASSSTRGRRRRAGRGEGVRSGAAAEAAG